MADEKTEQPTGKRLAEARKKGQVAKSHDFNSALVLGGVILVLSMYGSYFMSYLTRLTREFLWHQLRMAQTITVVGFETLLRDFMMHIAMLTLPLMAGILLVGVLANLIQVRFLFSTDTLKPNFGKLNPLPGFKRFVSVKSLIELVKGVIKIIIVGWCSFSVIHSHLDQLMGMSQMGFVQAWTVIWGIAMSICWAIAIALLVIGIADWWLQRYQLMKQLRMTKQEVKDEMKNSEGNPEVKRKVKNAGRMLMRKRMLKAVPQADVIVTNPTHFAVAIQYDPDLAPAPRVVAKGADHMAFKIREIAQENGIPILENKPLARGLYAAVEVDHMIPPDMFIAVAEVLAYVYKRNKGRGAARMRRIKKGGL